MNKVYFVLLFAFLSFNLNSQVIWVEEPVDKIFNCTEIGIIGGTISSYLMSLNATTSDSNCGPVSITHDYIFDPEATCDTMISVNITATDVCSNSITKSILVSITDENNPEWIGDTDDFLPEDIEIFIQKNTSSYTFPNGYFEDPKNGEIWPIFPLIEGQHFVDDCHNVTITIIGGKPSDSFDLGVHIIKFILDDGCNTLIHQFKITINQYECESGLICTKSCETLPNCHTCDITDLLNGVPSCLPEFEGSLLDWPPSLCNGEGVPHNMSWFSFIAGDTSLSIIIKPIECVVSNGAIGLQVGVYDFCEDDNGICIGGEADCSNGLDEVSIKVNGMELGEIYYLFVDGCNGSECSYTINVDPLEIDPEVQLVEGACPDELISFKYYFDSNENGLKDITESYLNLQSATDFIELEPSSILTNLNANRQLHLVEEGNYNLTFINTFFLPTNMPSNIEVIEDQGLIEYEFGLIVNGNNPAAITNVDLTAESLEICNNSISYSYVIRNTGNQILNDQVTIEFNSLIQYLDSDLIINESTDSTVTWSTGELLPFESITINVNFQLPSENFAGDVFCLNPSSTFSDSNNNTPLCFELRCSVDPNDKHGIPYRGDENYTLFNETLKYTIRFENLGNFYAEDIRIEDVLSSDLDYSTLRVLQSSHEIDRLWINRNGVLKIFFDSINLPSIEMDSILNKGFVQFSIDQNSDLEENTILKNTASIFFDKNAPIVTNTTSHTLVSMLPFLDATNEIKIADDLFIYPNPGSTTLHLDSKIDLNELESLRLINTSGQIVIEHKLDNHSINIQSLTNGLYILESIAKSGITKIAKYIKI